MNPDCVQQQISELINRLIVSGLSVKQFYPSVRQAPDGITLIGRKQSSGIALRDIPYEEVYKELDSTEAYDTKLVDGGLLVLQYKFSDEDGLIQHRLAYFPSPHLPTVDDAPELYKQDELYADVPLPPDAIPEGISCAEEEGTEEAAEDGRPTEMAKQLCTLPSGP